MFCHHLNNIIISISSSSLTFGKPGDVGLVRSGG